MLLDLHTAAVLLGMCFVDDLFLFNITLDCEHEQKALPVIDKMQCFWHSWGLSHDWKHNEVRFWRIHCAYIWVAQMPRSQWDLTIIVLITDNKQRTNRLLYPLLCMRAWGNHSTCTADFYALQLTWNIWQCAKKKKNRTLHLLALVWFVLNVPRELKSKVTWCHKPDIHAP